MDSAFYQVVGYNEQFVSLLEVIGITSLADLAGANARIILPELHQARRVLQLEVKVPYLGDLERMIQQAKASTGVAVVEEIEDESPPSALPPLKTSLTSVNIAHRRHLEQAKMQERKQQAREAYKVAEASATRKKRTGGGKGIRHLRPVRAWVGAAFVILLFACLWACVVCTVYLLMFPELLDNDYFYLAMGGLVIAVIGYIAVSFRAHCSVCRIRLYSFAGYNRNILAHCYPGLGYVLSTAVHCFFGRKFRCPGCGTTQRLTWVWHRSVNDR